MKSIRKQILALTLLIASMLTIACGDGSAINSDTTDGSESDATTNAVIDTDADELGSLDLNNETVTFFARSHERFDDEVSVDESTGEIVNDAIYDRELRVESRLNVNIETVKDGEQHGKIDEMERLVMAGDSSYDIFTASMYCVNPAAANGIFRNLNTLDYIDLSKPYYTQDYIRQTNISGKNYSLTGDISLSLTRYSFCMYFNKSLIENYNIENPYDLVRSGEWTHDKMRSLVTDIYQDLNQNSNKDEGDLYGLGTSNVIIIDAYMSAYDLNVLKIADNGMPDITLNVEKFADATEKLYQLNYETEGVFAYKEISDNNEMTDLCNYFSQDHLVFINSWIYGLETGYIRSMESDFGVLPYPKYDEAQEQYYTFQHDQIGVFAIPITSKKADSAAAVLEAMSSDSRKNLVPIYYDTALKNKYSRDTDTADMIDIIHNNHKLDPVWIYSGCCWGFAQIQRNLLLAGSSDFVSKYDSNREAWLAKYTDLFNKYLEIE